MRPTPTLFCIAFCALPTVAQERMPPGPYAPEDSTWVVHVDMQALRDSALGKSLAKSAIGKILAPMLDAEGEHRVDSIRIASVARPETTHLRSIWVMHVRGRKELTVPDWVKTLGVDVLADKAEKAEKANKNAMFGYFLPAPGELVLGEAEFLGARSAGKKLGPTSGAADRGAAYILRAEVRVPNVGVAKLGTWTMPLLDGVSYDRDPLQDVTVLLDRDARSGSLRLRTEFGFQPRGPSPAGLRSSLREDIARAMRDEGYFHFWPALQAMRLEVVDRGPRRTALAVSIDPIERRVFDSALGAYAPVVALVEHALRVQRSVERFGTEKVVVEVEEQAEEEIEEVETEAKKAKPKPRKGRKKRD